MLRLKSLLTIVLALSVSAGDVTESSEPGSGPSSTIAVVGDVLRPDTYQSPTGSAVSLRDALQTAGMVCATSQILVIRSDGSQVQQRSELVEATSGDADSQLTPGDVVVVRAAGPSEVSVRPSAALIDGQRVCGLTLDGSQVAIGDLLVHCGVPRERFGLVHLYSVVPGRARTQVPVSEIVQHGDVVVVGRPQGFSADEIRFAPRMSEWRTDGGHSGDGPADHVLLPTTVTSAPVPQEPWLAGSGPAAPEESEEGIRSADVRSGPRLPEIPQEANFQTDATQSDGADLSLSATRISLQSVSQDLPPAVSPAPELSASGGSALAANTEPAPIPPAEVSMAVGATETFSLWNLIFIVGLLVSGGLVAAGWLMSEAELRQQRLAGAVRESVSATVGTTLSEVAAQGLSSASVSDPGIPEVRRMAEPPSGAMAASAMPASEMPAQRGEHSGHRHLPAAGELVDRGEWYGTDWQSTTSAATQKETPVERPGSVPAADPFTELTDLICNRLPVDLCEAKLPLRVTLFGRAAGPRRLRIDASHTQLAPPHIRTSDGGASMRQPAGASMKTAPATVGSRPAERSAERPAELAGKTAEDVPVGRSPESGSPKNAVAASPDGPGPLDRALNLLQERDV